MSEVKEMASAVGATETGEEVLTMSREHSYVHNYSNIVLRAGQVAMRVQEVNEVGRSLGAESIYPWCELVFGLTGYELFVFYEGYHESIRTEFHEPLNEERLCEMLDRLDEAEEERRMLYEKVR